jgi:hypothetical protein
MTPARLLLTSAAVLAAAPTLAAPAMAAAPARIAAPAAARAAAGHLQRDVVLSVSGRRLTVVDPLLAVRRYTVAGVVPRGLSFGSQVSLRRRGTAASTVRLHGRTRAVAYLARVAGAGTRSVTLRTAGGTLLSYRAGRHETVALPSGTLRRGSEVLVNVTAGHRLGVSLRRAAGAPSRPESQVSGLVTAVSGGGSRTTLLTPSGLSLRIRVPGSLARAAGLQACRRVYLFYRSAHGRRDAKLLALSARQPTAGCAAMRGGNGFVTAVSPADRWVTVRTSPHQTVKLAVSGRTLRRIVDAASVTDYVAFTYTGARQAKLVSLTDTSTTGSGVVVALSRAKQRLVVALAHGHTVRLHVARTHAFAGLKRGDKVDIDYYRAAYGQRVLVNLDDQGPVQPGGNGGGRVDSGSGSGGSAGSSGAAGSWGSPGA